MSKELDEHLVRMYPVIIQDRSIMENDTVTGGDTLFFARGQDEPVESIKWQDGTIDPEKGANGVTLEALIRAGIARLQTFQKTKFKDRNNALAITALEEALGRLTMRREERFFRGVLNQHKV